MPMNVARRADGLLSARQTLALLEVVGQRAAGCVEEQALRDLAAIEHASRSRASNTIALLTEIGALERDGPSVRLANNRSLEEWSSHIGDLTASLMVRRIETDGPRCLQARGEDGLWLDSMLLPGTEDGLPLWLVEFGVAVRAGSRERFWKVAPRHQPDFLAAARAANRTHTKRPMTPAQLQTALAAQADRGLEAELWVVEYERRRLSTHPLRDQIRRVSEENVAAGYDIVSFSAPTVLHHDTHIEVKSFDGEKRFFWSRNEIETAKALAEAYVLYLVDRGRLGQKNYAPEIIRGPYSALFLSIDSGWSISPTTFECVADA